MATTIDEVRDHFVGLGYNWFAGDHLCHAVGLLQKRVFVEPVCQGNEKLWINVYLHTLEMPERYARSASIEICAESLIGVWLKLQAYSISLDDLLDQHGRYESMLVAAWKAANAVGSVGLEVDDGSRRDDEPPSED